MREAPLDCYFPEEIRPNRRLNKVGLKTSSSKVGRTIGTSDKFTRISSSVSGEANFRVFDCATRAGR
jgi:hypothetical protein